MERVWDFTDYKRDIGFLEDLWGTGKLTYLLAVEETCPSTERIHWQSMLIMKERINMKNLEKKYLGGERSCRALYEDSTPVLLMNYCKKGGNIVFEKGKMPVGQGKRTDLEDLRDMIVGGASEREIFEAMPGNFVRYHNGINRVRSLYQEKRNWEMDVRIYWGPPGTGKTRSAHEEFGDDMYVKMTGKWWDGYDGETCVLIDDFDPENCFDSTFDWYLKLLDRYNMKVEHKGGSSQFRSKVIIITSNFNPEEWFKYKQNRQAFFRRVKTIKNFT